MKKVFVIIDLEALGTWQHGFKGYHDKGFKMEGSTDAFRPLQQIDAVNVWKLLVQGVQNE